MDKNQLNQNIGPYVQTVNVEPEVPSEPGTQNIIQPEASAEPSESKKLERLLCFLSLGLYILGPSVISIPLYLLEIVGVSETPVMSVLSSIGSALGSISYIAAWVLMIIARVKFKKSVFAKVLMWVYIGIFAVSVLAVIILIISCIEFLRSCGL
ncbi:MAG: hypothetical protein K5669_09745 [Lachnospiraceae bacterium]|nr:hypothetical protein [Lachnospiraceae bacterium]